MSFDRVPFESSAEWLVGGLTGRDGMTFAVGERLLASRFVLLR
jgi:hypothetical protein